MGAIFQNQRPRIVRRISKRPLSSIVKEANGVLEHDGARLGRLGLGQVIMPKCLGSKITLNG
ncbi:MAG: hypothetical protein Q4G41_03245, partial [Coriobacteriales bacterium]|nr:hypothetical protein [Coriobacteriales bacterium]